MVVLGFVSVVCLFVFVSEFLFGFFCLVVVFFFKKVNSYVISTDTLAQ